MDILLTEVIKAVIIILTIVGLALAVAWLKKDIHIQTNIFALLPETQQNPELAKTQQYKTERVKEIQAFRVLKNGKLPGAWCPQTTAYLGLSPGHL